jgi:formate dehydrogenase major subunit
MATLYHILPGYLAPPLQALHPTLKDYLERETPKGGYWVNKPKFMISLLKAWWGDAATRETDFAYDLHPTREKADAYSHQQRDQAPACCGAAGGHQDGHHRT